MLTASQARTAAFMNEYGELISAEEAHDNLDDGTLELEQNWRPLSSYELDEWQAESAAGQEPEDLWGDEADEHTDECVPAIYSDGDGRELVEAYHYHREDPAVDEDERKASEYAVSEQLVIDEAPDA